MATLQALPLGQIQARGWLREQMTRDLEEGFASRLGHLTTHASRDLFTHRIASSQEQEAWWDSETRGNWLWGYTMMAFLAGHPEHQAHVKHLAESLKNSQDADGYIGIYAPQWRYQHPVGENGELWGQSRALLILLSYYELTQDPDYLQAVERAVTLTMSHYHADHPYYRRPDSQHANLTGLTHGLCYIDVLAWLYRITQNTTYRDYGVWLFADFSAMPTPFANDDLALQNLADAYRPFTGHAVHTVEHWRCLVWGAVQSDNSVWKQAIQQSLHKFAHYRLPSGAIIGDESIHGLPMPDMGYEYCTLTEWLFSLGVAIEQLGDVRLADDLETLAFNAGQGSRWSNGQGVTYLSTDTRLSATFARPDSYSFLHQTSGRFKLSPTHEDIACCCNPNAVRFLPHYVSQMWMRHENGVLALLYGACQLKTTIHGVAVTIDENTHYPFAHTIDFTVTPAQPLTFSVWLRKPQWAQEMIVTCDGAQITRYAQYVSVEKAWQAGDTIQVIFATEVRLMPYPNGEYSVHYGALQFALPIAHQLTPIKDYPVTHLHDYEVTPIEVADAYRPFILDDNLPHYGLSVQVNPNGDLRYPWDESPVQLVSANETLHPMGSVLLRRSAFPLRERR